MLLFILERQKMKYNFLEIEKNKINFWRENNFFIKHDNDKENFVVLLPPPNITGKLHLGHAWDGALQDFFIRYNHLQDKNVYYLPGYDHAGIATQVAVEKSLNKKINTESSQEDKEIFYKAVNEWKENLFDAIDKQWDVLGLSVQKSYKQFTLSEEVKELVSKVFVDLYNQKLIYKGKKIINWDVKLRSAISNIEVDYKKEKTNLFFIKYFLENSGEQYLEVATTRPETIFGDSALFINPSDPKYKQFCGKKAINPLNGKLLPILADEYVDKEYGTGVMKCTPAHDFNDYELGKKHKLEFITVFDKAGKLNGQTGNYKNIDRFKARKLIIELFTENNLIIKTESQTSIIPRSQRTNSIIEPRISEQWFLATKQMVVEMKKLQKNDISAAKFWPKRFLSTFNKWFEQEQDWCISRQLLWGHKIPVWYERNGTEIIASISKPISDKDFTQDPDVLDTWFSSSLWPLICTKFNKKLPFDGKQLLPTSLLVTGYDILFFWVGRMMFMNSYIEKNVPFKDVYVHGLMRDSQGRKMSKSLGNGIDPHTIIQKYGCDSLRFYLLSNSSNGMDISFNEQKIKDSWNFINKLFNAANFLTNLSSQKRKPDNITINILEHPINKWIVSGWLECKNEFIEKISHYKTHLAHELLRNFVWNVFCSKYIEFTKILSETTWKSEFVDTIFWIFKEIIVLLHPSIPFSTEHIFQELFFGKSILEERINSNTEIKLNDKVLVFNFILGSIKKINVLKNGIGDLIWKKISVNFGNIKCSMFEKYNFDSIIAKSTKLQINPDLKEEHTVIFSIKIEKFHAELLINNSEKNNLKENMEKRIGVLRNELNRSKKILSNKSFLEKAAEEKISNEKQKMKEYSDECAQFEHIIKNLV